MVIKHILRSRLFTVLYVLVSALMILILSLQGVIFLNTKDNFNTTKESYKIIGTMAPTTKNMDYYYNLDQINYRTNLSQAYYGYFDTTALIERWGKETLELRKHIGGYSKELERLEVEGVKYEYAINSSHILLSGTVEKIEDTTNGKEMIIEVTKKYKEKYNVNKIRVKNNGIPGSSEFIVDNMYYIFLEKSNDSYNLEYLDYSLPLYIDITGMNEKEVNDAVKDYKEQYEIRLNTFEVIFTEDIRRIKPVYERKVFLSEGTHFDSINLEENSNRVCIVSDEFARLNNLKIGDDIPIQLFEGKASVTQLRKTREYSFIESMSDSMNYEVVGIYDYVTDNYAGPFDILPNTIFIPMSAYPSELEIKYFKYSPSDLTFYIEVESNVEEVESVLSGVFEDRAEISYFDADAVNVSRVLGQVIDDMRWNLVFILLGYLVCIIALTATYYYLNRKEYGLKRSLGIKSRLLEKENLKELLYLSGITWMIALILYVISHKSLMSIYLEKKQIREFIAMESPILFGITKNELIFIPSFIVLSMLTILIVSIFLHKKRKKESLLTILSEKK